MAVIKTAHRSQPGSRDDELGPTLPARYRTYERLPNANAIRAYRSRASCEGIQRRHRRCFELIKHENEMIHNRMTWFLLLQGFMLAGVAFGWEKSRHLVAIFSSIGALTALSSFVTMRQGSSPGYSLSLWGIKKTLSNWRCSYWTLSPCV